ncbi:MAG: hypothetical protein JNL50_01515 [Phycisphaerae bacterium]|nr:hypothetical protein [Phycisphaerae bacterium]
MGLGGFAVERAAAQNAGTPPTWAAPFKRVCGGFPLGISAGDVNLDGLPDIAVVQTQKQLSAGDPRTSAPAQVLIYKNTGSWGVPSNGLSAGPHWTVTLPDAIDPVLIPLHVELVDVNDDNYPDVLVSVGAAEDPTDPPAGYAPGLYYFRFIPALQVFATDPVYYATAVPISRFRVADMNGDQLPDVVAATDGRAYDYSNSDSVRIFYHVADPQAASPFHPEEALLHVDPNNDEANMPTNTCVVGNFHRRGGIPGGTADIVTDSMPILSNNGNASGQFPTFTIYPQTFCSGQSISIDHDMTAGNFRFMNVMTDIATISGINPEIRVFRSPILAGGTPVLSHDCLTDVYPISAFCGEYQPTIKLHGIANAMLNSGSYLDLAATGCDPYVAILLGKGNSKFQIDTNDAAYFVSAMPAADELFAEVAQVIAVDLNLDGKIDLVTSNHYDLNDPPYDGTISVIINTTP